MCGIWRRMMDIVDKTTMAIIKPATLKTGIARRVVVESLERRVQFWNIVWESAYPTRIARIFCVSVELPVNF